MKDLIDELMELREWHQLAACDYQTGSEQDFAFREFHNKNAKILDEAMKEINFLRNNNARGQA